MLLLLLAIIAFELIYLEDLLPAGTYYYSDVGGYISSNFTILGISKEEVTIVVDQEYFFEITSSLSATSTVVIKEMTVYLQTGYFLYSEGEGTTTLSNMTFSQSDGVTTISGQILLIFYGTILLISLTFSGISVTGHIIQAGSQTSYSSLTITRCYFDRITGRACSASISSSNHLTVTGTTFNKCIQLQSEEDYYSGSGAIYLNLYSSSAKFNLGGVSAAEKVTFIDCEAIDGCGGAVTIDSTVNPSNCFSFTNVEFSGDGGRTLYGKYVFYYQHAGTRPASALTPDAAKSILSSQENILPGYFQHSEYYYSSFYTFSSEIYDRQFLRTYYVTPGSLDVGRNCLSPSFPCPTVSAATQLAISMESILLQSGTYYGETGAANISVELKIEGASKELVNLVTDQEDFFCVNASLPVVIKSVSVFLVNRFLSHTGVGTMELKDASFAMSQSVSVAYGIIIYNDGGSLELTSVNFSSLTLDWRAIHCDSGALRLASVIFSHINDPYPVIYCYDSVVITNCIFDTIHTTACHANSSLTVKGTLFKNCVSSDFGGAITFAL